MSACRTKAKGFLHRIINIKTKVNFLGQIGGNIGQQAQGQTSLHTQ
jgi:hypothetical protein